MATDAPLAHTSPLFPLLDAESCVLGRVGRQRESRATALLCLVNEPLPNTFHILKAFGDSLQKSMAHPAESSVVMLRATGSQLLSDAARDLVHVYNQLAAPTLYAVGG